MNETGSNYCVWELPYCEFSTWSGSLPAASTDDTGSTGGGGSGGGGSITTKDKVVDDTVDGTDDSGVVDAGDESVVGDSGELEVAVEPMDYTWPIVVLAVVVIAIILAFVLRKKH